MAGHDLAGRLGPAAASAVRLVVSARVLAVFVQPVDSARMCRCVESGS